MGQCVWHSCWHVYVPSNGHATYAGVRHQVLLQALTHSISRVSVQNGVSLLYIMLEIHHSGREPSI